MKTKSKTIHERKASVFREVYPIHEPYVYAAVVEQMRCIGCRLCCITCPDMAIEMQVNGTMYHYFSY